ncbi:MAG: hypothetical protein WDN00_00810 [Limisphaerales bacterium]
MPTVAILWLAGLVWLNLAGWLLAALHQLNPAGYALMLLPGFFLAGAWLKKNPPPPFRPQKFVRRFRRPLPFFFLLVTILVFLGGVLYAPNNFDALTYRLPRMLNWLAAGHWFWIPTINERQNVSGVVWEWIAMPMLALTRLDRGLFLINAIGFLLMPGLLFSIFRRLGVARRVAWTWMWLVPLAYGYATQAGGIGNDLTGTVLLLLSVYHGLRARQFRCADGRLAGAVGGRFDDRRESLQSAPGFALSYSRLAGLGKTEETRRRQRGRPRHGHDHLRPADDGPEPSATLVPGTAIRKTNLRCSSKIHWLAC